MVLILSYWGIIFGDMWHGSHRLYELNRGMNDTWHKIAKATGSREDFEVHPAIQSLLDSIAGASTPGPNSSVFERIGFHLPSFYPLSWSFLLLTAIFFGQQTVARFHSLWVYDSMLLFNVFALTISMILFMCAGNACLDYFGLLSGDAMLSSHDFFLMPSKSEMFPGDSTASDGGKPEKSPILDEALVKLINIARIVRLQYQLSMYELLEVSFVICMKRFQTGISLMNVYIKLCLMWAWWLGARHVIFCAEEEIERRTSLGANWTELSGLKPGYDASSIYESIPKYSATASHLLIILFIWNIFNVLQYGFYCMLVIRCQTSGCCSVGLNNAVLEDADDCPGNLRDQFRRSLSLDSNSQHNVVNRDTAASSLVSEDDIDTPLRGGIGRRRKVKRHLSMEDKEDADESGQEEGAQNSAVESDLDSSTGRKNTEAKDSENDDFSHGFRKRNAVSMYGAPPSLEAFRELPKIERSRSASVYGAQNIHQQQSRARHLRTVLFHRPKKVFRQSSRIVRDYFPALQLAQHSILLTHACAQYMFIYGHWAADHVCNLWNTLVSLFIEYSNEPELNSLKIPIEAPGSVLKPTNSLVAFLELMVCSQLLLLYTDFNAQGSKSSQKKDSSTAKNQEKTGTDAGTGQEKRISESSTQSNEDNERSLDGNGAKFVFSFDASGWLMCYHYGVAAYLHDHFRGEFPPEMAFSGASGGALTGGALATGIHPMELADWVGIGGFSFSNFEISLRYRFILSIPPSGHRSLFPVHLERPRDV